MQIPYLFVSDLASSPKELMLDEEQSRHAIQVLRMHPGDSVYLTDGKGQLCLARITTHSKKACQVTKGESSSIPVAKRRVRIAISLLKNPARFEWFLEKATEIGVSEVIPLLCERTTRAHFRYTRMQQVIISALIQSRQAWMPILHEPIPYMQLNSVIFENERKWVAHCMPGEKKGLSVSSSELPSTDFILIGPEGDFTPEEVQLAVGRGFIPVSLGDTRLRTETAGIVAATLLQIGM